MTPAAHLAAVDPALGALIAATGPIKLGRPENPEPYAALMHSVAHQQLHGRAAEAILGRLRAQHGGAMPAPAALLAMPDDALRACGFSAGKAASLRDIAAKALDGTIPTRAQARRLSNENLIERLTTIRGVGQWTVEMLLMFTLNRPDVFPVDDFGVREGYRRLHKLSAQPKPKAFALLGQVYAPHRTLAAMYLWRAADQPKEK